MLINCVAYQEGKKLCDIPVEDISDYLDKPGCFVWVALRDATDAEMAQMKEEFSLHELAVEDAARGHQRPKIEEYGDCLFTVVHMLDLVDGDHIATGELAIFAGANYVLSVRRDSTKGFLGVRARAEREPHLLKMGSAFVMYALMDAVVDRYFPVVDMLESELETIEDRIFTHGAQRENVERLYQLKRKGLVLRHAVFPLLEAIGRLHGGRVPALVVGTARFAAVAQQVCPGIVGHEVHRIDHGHHGVEAGEIGEGAAMLVGEREGRGDRQRLGNAGRFDQEVVEPAFGGEAPHFRQQILAQRAADAAVGEFDQRFGGAR